jgi:hypothetical protein
MDAYTFDRLSKIAATSMSRRSLMRRLAAVAVGGTMVKGSLTGAAARPSVTASDRSLDGPEGDEEHGGSQMVPATGRCWVLSCHEGKCQWLPVSVNRATCEHLGTAYGSSQGWSTWGDAVPV